MSDSPQTKFSEREKTRQAVSALLKKKGISAQQREAISPRPVHSPCPASFAQRRLWLLEHMAPGNRYIMHFVLRLKGQVNLESLNRAWKEILRRHEVLRTTFGLVDEEVMQVISPDLNSALMQVDLTKDEPSQREIQAQRLLAKQAEEGFDLAHGPLVRMVGFKLGEEDFILSLTMHHIIADGWSMVVLVRELTELYAAFSENRLPRLRPLTIQYADFAWWQRQRLSGEFLEKQLSYWKRQLSNAPFLDLPVDHPRPKKEGFRGSHYTFHISEEIAKRLRELGRKNRASLFMVLLAAWQALLYRYSGQSDVVVGAPIANRMRVEIESLIGFFVNTLVLRTAVEGNLNFTELLSRVIRTTLDAYEHQDVPYEKLVAELQPERTVGQTPFFGTVLNWVNMPDSDLEFAGTQSEFVQSAPLENPMTKFDLSLNVVERSGALPASFEYSTELYEAATIARMSRHFQNLLAAIATNADQPVAELPLLEDRERNQVLSEWNQTRRQYPPYGTVLDLLEAQAQESGEKPAVVFAGRSLSYHQLNLQANQLAHFLRKLGVGPELLVGICMERSEELIIALLAIMKSGGAYVPLDPSNPAERLHYMLNDARPAVVLTQKRLRQILPGFVAHIVCLDDDWGVITTNNGSNPVRTVEPGNTAYVIYTSGSTGTPKGVMVQHGSLLNYLLWARDSLLTDGVDYLPAITSLGFDASLKQILGPLLIGGTVYLLAEHLTDPGKIFGFGSSKKRMALNCVPSLWRQLVEDMEKNPDGVPGNLDQLWLGGESCTPDLIERSLRIFPDLKISNLYGPTEATANAVYAERISPEHLYIGKPIANTKAFVLDVHLQPVPVGVTGELYIGGKALARGYWNKPELTAEKFIPDPFSNEAGTRLYRTGDLVGWRADGEIEYVGRSDNQIKLRGFRIELEEIEAVLTQHDAVRQAAVVVQETGEDKKLIAYVVPADGVPLQTAALRSYVQQRLPEYMTPAAFVELASLPLSAHGKVDRKALPRWEYTRAQSEYEHPHTPTEELVAGIWSEVLGIEKIGIHNNFFELGGHSLLAMQVTSRLRSALQVELPFSDIFEAPTISRLATQIALNRREKRGAALPPLTPAHHSGPQPLSFAQQRLWFMDRLHPNSTFYNISGAVRLSGELDLAALEHAVRGVSERHQVFRTRFVLEGDQSAQIIETDIRLGLEYHDLRLLEPNEREGRLSQKIREESQKPFALDRAPLARMILLRLDEQEYVLFISMHHIISDGWSISVLIRELTELYATFSQGRPSSLLPLPVQYTDYARWQLEYLQGEVLERYLNYWRAQLDGAPVLELPTDRPRSVKESFRGAYHGFVVPLELAAELRSLARSERATLFMVFLAAWETLLSRYAGQTDFTQGMPVANRSLPKTERLIGFFVNTLVLRINLAGDPKFNEVLQRTRKTTLEAYDYQELPFEKLVADLHPERSLGQTPLFRVMFNWVNTPPATLKFSGVSWEMVPLQHTTANFDLTFSAGGQDGALPVGFEYSTDLYDEPTISRMANHLLVMLRAIVRDPSCPIATMPLLTQPENEQLLVEWNRTTVDFGHSACVHELVELQAQNTPNAAAIVSDHEVITYAELDQGANRLAHWLQSKGAGAEKRVGVCLPRSPRMLIALLGILKSGGAYVPLDPSYPSARLKYIAKDSGLQLILTESALKSYLSLLGVETVCLDLFKDELARGDTIPDRKAMPENAAYIIYTSGSTGRSKGVVARHSSVVNQVLWMKSAFGLTSSDRVIHKASVNFDASVAEIFAPLAAGAQVIVAGPEDDRNIHSLVHVMKTHKVTFIDLSPTMLHALLEEPEIQECSALRLVVSGGEVLAADLESKTLKLLRTQLCNTYGPTETTVQSTFWACAPEHHYRSVPIGGPIANTRVYVLDESGQPVPVGDQGELCIAGAGLARGYLNRPELTAEKFAPDPFSCEPGERLYKSGDRVRWRADAALEFLGRIDQQVKVRGFRIEPGEIESALLTHSQIREVAVIIREDSTAGKQIVAFIVTDKGPGLSLQELRQHVKSLLPFYMRPSRYVLVEGLPLNVNGKIDRNALMRTHLPEETHKAALPETPTEKILCGIWAAVLKREEVGVEDDFFAFGGHSLLAVSLISQITRCFGRDLALDKVFQYSTPREMARLVDQPKRDFEPSAVICMNKGSDDLPPLYLMYPVGGNILCYSDLSRFINPNRPLYGIQAAPDDRLKSASLEEIAALCLQTIRKKDRNGRYELGGWSFGGLLAFEVARQASAAGDPPGTLYLLDPPVLEKISRDDEPDEEMVGLFVLTLIADFSGGKPLDLEELRTKFDPRESSLEAQLRRAIELGLLPATVDPAKHAQSFEIFRRNMRAARMYRPRKYPGKTIVVLAEASQSEVWPGLVPTDTRVVRVPGNHFTMMRGSNAAKIAKLIDDGAASVSL